MRCVASFGAWAESRIGGDMRRYAGIRALKRASARSGGSRLKLRALPMTSSTSTHATVSVVMSKSTNFPPAASPIDSQETWVEFQAQLPDLRQRLMASEVFNHEKKPPAAGGRGIYLFSEGETPLYVGRTGITARARAAGKDPRTSFLHRWNQHTASGSSPNSAPFAMKLARELANCLGLEGPRELKERFGLRRTEEWWSLRTMSEPPDYYLAFQAAKSFIGELNFQVIAFDDDVRGVRSHMAEVYMDVVLQTTYGDFSPS